MIRREIDFSNIERFWLLVSQVDHAHVSGEIARQWNDELSSDVIEAIRHHDDGWAAWEAEPKLNPAIGAPYSFLEMLLPESLLIWDSSIATARKFGPLAGYIVAGHFYGLLNESDHVQEPMAVAWLMAKRKAHTAWLDEWVRAAATHTLESAKQAQQMLLVSDLFSLWLCCECPIAGLEGNVLDQSAMKPRADKLRGEFKFDVVGFGRRHPTPESNAEAFAWVVAVEPYPFKTSPVSFSTEASIAPAEFYPTWSELVANSRQIELRWRLIPAGELTSALS